MSKPDGMTPSPIERAESVFNKIFEHQKEGFKGGFNDESAWSSYSVKSEDIIKSMADAFEVLRLEILEETAKLAESMKEYRKSAIPEYMFGEAYACEDIAKQIRQLGQDKRGESTV